LRSHNQIPQQAKAHVSVLLLFGEENMSQIDEENMPLYSRFFFIFGGLVEASRRKSAGGDAADGGKDSPSCSGIVYIS
jgi:hypothetical protein